MNGTEFALIFLQPKPKKTVYWLPYCGILSTNKKNNAIGIAMNQSPKTAENPTTTIAPVSNQSPMKSHASRLFVILTELSKHDKEAITMESLKNYAGIDALVENAQREDLPSETREAITDYLYNLPGTKGLPMDSFPQKAYEMNGYIMLEMIGSEEFRQAEQASTRPAA